MKLKDLTKAAATHWGEEYCGMSAESQNCEGIRDNHC
jgi:hypothetical protein